MRQEVNVPLIKETKKTLLSRIDDAPSVEFKCLDKEDIGRVREKVVNEIWLDCYDKNNFELVDVAEKNNVLLYGRAIKKLNYVEGEFKVKVLHNLDFVIDPNVDPLDVETARFMDHLHIKRTLNEIMADERYLTEGKNSLKERLSGLDKESGGGLLNKDISEENEKAKKEITEDLGVGDVNRLEAFDCEVELLEHYTNIWNNETKKWERWVFTCDNECTAILSEELLKDAIGVEFWPFVSWADDVDSVDFWNDGMGDVVLVPNKIINVYLSSDLESRELNNFGMNWYLPGSGFDPSTYEPEPFGMYPAPIIKDELGRTMSVDQVIKQMNIPVLQDNIVNIDYLTKIVERATAATAIEKGVGEEGQMTLGEVETLVAKASERIMTISKFYRRAWKEFAWKWRKIMEANASDDDAITLYKAGPDGNYYEKAVYKKDWFSEKGFREKIISKSEKEADDTATLNKILYIKGQIPNNAAFSRIAEKRMLDMIDLSPEEMEEVKQESQKMKMNQAMSMQTEQPPMQNKGQKITLPAGEVAPAV
jgi:hypothetical protein